MADEKKEQTTQQVDQPVESEQQAPEQTIPTEDINKRIKPAMSIIREIFARIDSLREKEAQEKATKDAVELAQQNAEVVAEQPKDIYVSLDGDNIGNAVARAEEKDDERLLSEISSKINAGQDVLKQWAISHGGKLIEAGGDEGLVKVPSHAKEKVEELRQQYRRIVGATATVGVGEKISESTKARMLGKLRGKNRVVFWEPQLQKELDLRTKESGGEAGKIKAAGLAGAEEPQLDLDSQEPKQEQPAQPAEQESKSVKSQKTPQEEPEEDDEEEGPWEGFNKMMAPEDDDEEPIPHSNSFPKWLVDEALSHGMEPHTYALLLRSNGYDIR